ncbi:MAG: 30S ribosomal protein THX [Pseudomonadota bacterium]
MGSGAAVGKQEFVVDTGRGAGEGGHVEGLSLAVRAYCYPSQCKGCASVSAPKPPLLRQHGARPRSRATFAAVGFALYSRPIQQINSFRRLLMGRGDKRTRKGKIFRGSFGNSRPKSDNKSTSAVAAVATGKKG